MIWYITKRRDVLEKSICIERNPFASFVLFHIGFRVFLIVPDQAPKKLIRMGATKSCHPDIKTLLDGSLNFRATFSQGTFGNLITTKGNMW
jgi:hypothetical protein